MENAFIFTKYIYGKQLTLCTIIYNNQGRYKTRGDNIQIKDPIKTRVERIKEEKYKTIIIKTRKRF